MCGIVGIYSKNRNQQISSSVFQSLIAQQHRGQESSGIFTFYNGIIGGIKEMGLATEVFNKNNLAGLFGNAGVGHVRYSTAGASTLENASPYFLDSPFIKFALSFNGNLTNFNKLKKEYAKNGHIFSLSADTEVLAQVIAKKVLEKKDYIEGIKEAMAVLKGAYSVILLNDKGELYGFKDPLGFKPLCIGKTKELSIIASESVGIDVLKGGLIKNLEPSEIVKIENNGSFSSCFGQKCERKAFCVFEYVYLARPETRFKNDSNESVYGVRYKLGKNLAESFPVKADVVIPVPDSGRTAGNGYADKLKIPYREGLMKNRYVHRTFIMHSQDSRDDAVLLKLNPVKEEIENKDVALVDDSIVRGTTCRQIVKMVRDAGVKSVHLRISCPPLIAPCYMGVDISNKNELIASKKTIEEIKNYLKVDSLGYQTIEGLVNATGLKENELCLACLTGKYPTELEDLLE